MRRLAAAFTLSTALGVTAAMADSHEVVTGDAPEPEVDECVTEFTELTPELVMSHGRIFTAADLRQNLPENEEVVAGFISSPAPEGEEEFDAINPFDTCIMSFAQGFTTYEGSNRQPRSAVTIVLREDGASGCFQIVPGRHDYGQPVEDNKCDHLAPAR